MVFTRSIRRKMVVGLALIFLMQLAFTLSGISGISSYRRMVRDLEHSIRAAPRRADLLAILCKLIPPLASDPTKPILPPQVRAKQFYDQLDTVREQLVNFRKQIQTNAANPRVFSDEKELSKLVGETETSLKYLSGFADDDLSENEHAEFVVGVMNSQIAKLMDDIDTAPDSAERMNQILENAHTDYQYHYWMVCLTGGVGFLVMVGLAVYGYWWFVVPIRQLHQGALRVAGGDFDFRVQIASEDEICSLAQAFNKMTRRFQAETQNREKLVAERSRQLVQSERFAGVGFLSAGVAHEINNPLQIMSSMAESVESRIADYLPPDSPDTPIIREYLSTIISEADRAQRITHRLLDFAHGSDGNRHRYDLTAIVHDVADMLGHLSRYRDRPITVNFNDPCELEMNGPEIKQVVLNLLANALDASEPGSDVVVAIMQYPDQVELTIADHGAGMTPEILLHLFEPGFTTKDVGKGTGLGLSISHCIVADHNGTLKAESAGPGQGSTFRLSLPVKVAARKAA